MIRVSKKWGHVCLLVALFAIAVLITTLVIQRWKQAKAVPNHQGSLDNIAGLAAEDVVELPKLPTLENIYVDLGAPGKDYLLCVLVSTECSGCAQDERFWKDLRKEI